MKVTIELNPQVDIEKIISVITNQYDDEILARYDLLETFDSSEDEDDFARTMYCWISESRDYFDEDFNTAFYWNKEFCENVLKELVAYVKENRDAIEQDYHEFCEDEEED